MRMLLPLAALALLAAPLPAAACSVAAGYRVPTNLELVEAADLILLATVSPADLAPEGAGDGQFEIQPLAALKGTMPAEPFAMAGMIDADALLSNPYELKDAHPQSLAGACNRYAFSRGSRVLFFLRWEGDHWRPAGGPFSRWAEDVLTDEAPWLQVVRLYAEAAGLPPGERAAYLSARRGEYGAEESDPVAQLIAADIARQLAGPDAPIKGELPPLPEEADEHRSMEEAAEGADHAAEAAERAAAAAEAAAREAEASPR